MTTDPRDAEIARLKAENEALRTGDWSNLRLVRFENGQFDFSGSPVQYIAEFFAQAMENGEGDHFNNMEIQFGHPKAGAMVLTVQRKQGLTPTEQRKKAEAERDAALAREAALLASNQTNRDLLYQLTGAQSEVTHMRNRFDTAIAGAYEAAAQKVSHEWEKQQPWRNTGGMNATETCATIRALTPADALAALSRRDAQMRAEGRKEGLREAADEIEGTALEADWFADTHGRQVLERAKSIILAAAEKEAQG